MKVKPKKSNAAIHKQIIKKSEYDKKIKEARNVGVKMGAIVMCRVISGIISQSGNNEEKLKKINDFCLNAIEKRCENL